MVKQFYAQQGMQTIPFNVSFRAQGLYVLLFQIGKSEMIPVKLVRE